MPGIDKNRFVNMLPEMEDEFTCGICHGVFDTPVVVPCCQQTYCRECITEWVNANHNCPVDRRPLSANQLMPAPRNMTNILARFLVHCRYHDKGCPHVCAFELENNHVRTGCEYNPDRLCSNCGALKDVNCEHNCVQHLYGLVRSAGESTRDVLATIIDLRESVDNAMECSQIEVVTLRSEVDAINKRQDELMKRVDNLSVTMNSLLSKLAKLESNVNGMGYAFISLIIVSNRCLS